MNAYEGLLPPGQYPLYVLFLTIDPARLDVNIHPTKTEIKFDEDQHIQSLLLPSIRRGLGKHAVAPSLDFDQNPANIAPLPKDRVVAEPVVQVNTDYNRSNQTASGGSSGWRVATRRPNGCVEVPVRKGLAARRSWAGGARRASHAVFGFW